MTIRTRFLLGLLLAVFAVSHVVAAARMDSVRHGAQSETIVSPSGD
jgi:hypothetical protein